MAGLGADGVVIRGVGICFHPRMVGLISAVAVREIAKHVPCLPAARAVQNRAKQEARLQPGAF